MKKVVFYSDVYPNVTLNQDYGVVSLDENTIFIVNNDNQKIGVSYMADPLIVGIFDNDVLANIPFIEENKEPGDPLNDRVDKLESVIDTMLGGVQ